MTPNHVPVIRHPPLQHPGLHAGWLTGDRALHTQRAIFIHFHFSSEVYLYFQPFALKLKMSCMNYHQNL